MFNYSNDINQQGLKMNKLEEAEKQIEQLTKERDEFKEDGEILRKQMKSRQEHDDEHHTRLLKKLQAEKQKVKAYEDIAKIAVNDDGSRWDEYMSKFHELLNQ